MEESPILKESSLRYLRWQTDIGTRAQTKLTNGKRQVNPLTVTGIPDSSLKNLLKAYVVYSTDGGQTWRSSSWRDHYLSGWNSKNPFITAGNVCLSTTGRRITGADFNNALVATRRQWLQQWARIANHPVSNNLQVFSQSNCHTEQTFLYDVIFNQKHVSKIPTVQPRPQVSHFMLYLFSTRPPCGRCKTALEALLDGVNQNQRIFMQNTFNSRLDTATADFRIIVSNIRETAPILLNDVDLQTQLDVINVNNFGLVGDSFAPAQMGLLRNEKKKKKKKLSKIKKQSEQPPQNASPSKNQPLPLKSNPYKSFELPSNFFQTPMCRK